MMRGGRSSWAAVCSGSKAACALRELGLHVTLLERGPRLLARQFDERTGDLVRAHLGGLGIDVRFGVQAATVQGSERVRGLMLGDGTSLPCDILLAAVGIRPNAGLASAAGIAVNRGVIVDDRMQTSVPGVLAAGDVAEHHGRVLGLWPVAVKQAEIAAINALGGDERMTAGRPATIVKGLGLELAAVGQQEPGPEGEVIIAGDPGARSSGGWFSPLVALWALPWSATTRWTSPPLRQRSSRVSSSARRPAPRHRQATGRPWPASQSQQMRYPWPQDRAGPYPGRPGLRYEAPR